MQPLIDYYCAIAAANIRDAALSARVGPRTIARRAQISAEKIRYDKDPQDIRLGAFMRIAYVLGYTPAQLLTTLPEHRGVANFAFELIPDATREDCTNFRDIAALFDSAQYVPQPMLDSLRQMAQEEVFGRACYASPLRVAR